MFILESLLHLHFWRKIMLDIVFWLAVFVFFLSTLNISYHPLWAYKVSAEKPADDLMWAPFSLTSCFSYCFQDCFCLSTVYVSWCGLLRVHSGWRSWTSEFGCPIPFPDLGSFGHLFIQISCLCLFLSFFGNSHHVHINLLNGIHKSHLSFLDSIFFWLLWLGSFKWLIFEFAVSNCGWNSLVNFSIQLLYSLASELVWFFFMVSVSLLMFLFVHVNIVLISFSYLCFLVDCWASLG